ncbi:hypothetical protein Ancab_029667 [Ancistrocladus abbreviatus]
MQVLHHNETKRGFINRGAIIDLRNAKVRSYADAIRCSEGLFRGGSKIGGAPRRTNGYAEVGWTNQLPSLSIRWEAGVIEALKKAKKESKKLNKMDGKMLCFNEEDGDGVHSGESVSDSQFLNRNRLICASNEKSDESGPNLYSEQIWNFLS